MKPPRIRPLSKIGRLCLTCPLDTCLDIYHEDCPINRARTPRQRKPLQPRILKLLADHAGEPLTKNQVSEKLGAKGCSVGGALTRMFRKGQVTRYKVEIQAVRTPRVFVYTISGMVSEEQSKHV